MPGRTYTTLPASLFLSSLFQTSPIPAQSDAGSVVYEVQSAIQLAIATNGILNRIQIQFR